MHQGFFIDDQDAIYAEILSKKDELQIDFLEVSELIPMAKNIFAKKPSIVAVDYRLDEKLSNLQANQAYKGSALAQQLRDTAIEFPENDFALVLISAEAKLEHLFRPDWTAHDLFDLVYTKGALVKNPAIAHAEMIDLCGAYETLRGQIGAFDLVALTNISHEDAFNVDFQELRTKVNSAAAPHLVVREILKNLVMKTGPLLSQGDIAANLGVRSDDVWPALAALDASGARYSGLLSTAWPRWWAYRFDSWAREIFSGRPTRIPANERVKILSEKLGVALDPAKSPWNNKTDELLVFACACCGRPAEIRHSLAVFDQDLPRFSTPRRICWDCVQQGTCAGGSEPLMIADADRELAEKVKTMPRDSEAPK